MSESEEVNMETLSGLVDRISIVNIKIWHLEEKRNDKKLPDKERLEAADKLTLLNRQRRKLCQEFDELMKKIIETKEVPIVEQISV